MVFDGRLVFPPVMELKRVLDLGYGSGAWAFAVANNYPGCEVRYLSAISRILLMYTVEVVGVDISLHMLPDEIPENFEPQVRSATSIVLRESSIF